MKYVLKVIVSFFVLVNGQFDPHWRYQRDVIVHLFEWKWSDIADECERFLAPKGFAGIQISPPTENLIISNRPWWERYQPVSYILSNRSGNETALRDMLRRCNAVGVRVYADVILNHMAGGYGIGTAGTTSNPGTLQYSAVPYGPGDFNPSCSIYSYEDIYQVRNCRLVGMPDLNQGNSWVRDRIVGFLNHLIDIGIAGFRIDAAKHMWPRDLEIILGKIKNLNTTFGFKNDARPFIFQEVIDLGGHGISAWEYSHLGRVTEFKYSAEIGRVFRGYDKLKWLQNFGEAWGFLPSEKAFIFVDNHDNQRGHGGRGSNVLTYKQSKQYKMATAFHLAWPYGVSQIMSSFDFNDGDQGPSSDKNGNIISPIINPDDTCSGGWVCEHRWRQIYNMVKFRIETQGTGVNDWWDNGNNQIAFGRGDRGFILFNNEQNDLYAELQTGLPAGTYCDIISGRKKGNICTGLKVDINENRKGNFVLAANGFDGVMAFHVGARL